MGFSRMRVTRDGQHRYTAYYWDVRGRERSAGTFAHKRDADRAWRRAETKVGQGRFVDLRSGRQTFRRYVTEVWLPNHPIEISTRQGYAYVLDKHIMGEFGRMRMIEILPSHIRDFLSRLLAEGASAYTVQRCKTVLGAIFTTALADEVVFLNPTSGVKAPPTPVRPLRILTPAEFERLLAALPEPRWRLLAELAVETGVRWGELAELRVSDLDLGLRTVTVARTVVELSRRVQAGDSRFVVKAYPKDREYRVLGISGRLAATVAAHVAEHQLGPDDLLFSRSGPMVSTRPSAGRGSGWIVPDVGGRRFGHGTLSGYSGGCRCSACRGAYADYRARRRAAGLDCPRRARSGVPDPHLSARWFRTFVWKPALAVARIGRSVRIHDLRHANASWMLAGGADVQVVRVRLGHSGLRATERYLHCLPGEDDRALRALAKARAAG